MEIDMAQADQPVGQLMADWKAPPRPARDVQQGRFCRLEPLNAAVHAESLYASNQLDEQGRNWTYLPYGPFESLAEYRTWIAQTCSGDDPLFFAIRDLATGEP